jgi:hypothetical protein
MLCRQNGAANLKCRHDVECCLATSSRKLGLSFGCADKGLSGVGRQCFYLALLIALSCPCSRLRNHPVRQENCRVIPVVSTSAAAARRDNLAFAGRFDATVIDQKMGLDDEELAFGSSPGSLPKGTAARPFWSRSNVSAAASQLWYAKRAGRPIWLLLAAITWSRKRHAAGLRPWSARRLSRVADGGTTSMLRRDGVRYLTPWTPSGACGNVCGRATASGIGGDRKGGDEDDRDDCQHCNLALPNSRKSLPERQRTAFAIMIERLGCDHAIDVYNAGGLADLVAAHGNHALELRQAAGQDTMGLSRRDGVRFSTARKPGGALAGRP